MSHLGHSTHPQLTDLEKIFTGLVAGLSCWTLKNFVANSFNYLFNFPAKKLKVLASIFKVSKSPHVYIQEAERKRQTRIAACCGFLIRSLPFTPFFFHFRFFVCTLYKSRFSVCFKKKSFNRFSRTESFWRWKRDVEK